MLYLRKSNGRKAVPRQRALTTAHIEGLGGKRPFGWERDREPVDGGGEPMLDHDGEPVKGILRLRQAEADALAQAHRDVLDGATLGSICRDWNARGITTPTGKQWRGGELGRVLKRPRNAGLMEYRGQISGAAQWPAVVDETTWRAVVASAPGRQPPSTWTGSDFTIVDGRYISPTPCMLGAQPATYGLLAPLADDEELGYRLVNSLDAAQRRAAVIHHRPPPDLAARMVPRLGETERPDAVFAPEPDYVISDEERDILSYVRFGSKGVPAAAFGQQQLDLLAALVGGFARRLPDELAGAQMHDLERAGLDNLAFAWEGGTSPGERHYYRVQGPALLIEHDNTQGNGNHIHSAWRNPADDFGDDVLAEHYRLHHA